jgi:L-asparaginase II
VVDDGTRIDVSASRPEPLAEIIRNGMVESAHYGHLIILDSSASEKFMLGDAASPIFPRSSIKPIQARAMVKLGLKIEPRLLALVIASHSGSVEHIEGVRQLLSQFSLSESDLQCAVDLPLGEVERKIWGDKPPLRIAMNCSGKHAGMLATCVVNGWDTSNYLEMNHPLQIAIKGEIEEFSGNRSVNDTFDGCGAPLFAIPLRALAQAIRSVVESRDPASQAVVHAMSNHPEMVAGSGRLSTRWMEAVPGLIMKEGAEGVHIAAQSGKGVIAFKVIDGSMRAHDVITRSALAQIGITAEILTGSVFGGPAPKVEIRASF